MTKRFITETIGGKDRFPHLLRTLAPMLAVLALTAGCQTDKSFPLPAQSGTNVTKATEVITLRESDVLKISFPANANLNTTQPIRRDGMISMPLIGEVKATGKTPKELEKDLVDLYSTQLLSKEVTVEVQSSTFPVYVTGSVLKAGRIVADHPLTAFEAIMEAGGFDYARANLKAVVVIRQEGDHVQKFILNLKQVMEGKAGAPFYLKPGDTIYVPERFTWF
jgi:polysaccharide export outer membrane protein